MQVTKRNGVKQDLNLNKILKRLKDSSVGLQVDSESVALQTIQGLYDGVTTKELDTLAAKIAAGKNTLHPDYSKLASNITVSRLQKDIKPDIKSYITRAKDKLHESVIEKLKLWQSDLEDIVDFQRDYNFDFFGINTMMQTYLAKDKNGVIIELPQHVYLRVGLYLCDSIKEFKMYYEKLSNQLISFATPILINGGTTNSSMISCSVVFNAGDSLEGILDTMKNISLHSADSSGIGLCVDNLRASSSRIKSTGGLAHGIIPYAKIVQDLMIAYNQGGARNGSCALFMSVWHKDIFKFLELKKHTGDEKLRARDIFLAVNIPNNFMEALRNNEDYYLFCPNDLKNNNIRFNETWGIEFEKEYDKAVELGVGLKVKAQDIFKLILDIEIESGIPYIHYIDHTNNKSNHQHYGKIKSLQLCVSGDTEILTDNGYFKIKDVVNTKINVWNGFEFSNTIPYLTNKNVNLSEVTFNNKTSVKCTEYHKWFVYEDTNRSILGQNIKKQKYIIKTTNELKKGDIILKHDFPILNQSNELNNAYTNGFFSADGHYEHNNPFVRLYGVKKDLIPYLSIRNKQSTCYYHIDTGMLHISKEKTQDRIKIGLVKSLENKYFVPINFSIKSKLEWFEGFCDGDGTVCNNKGIKTIQVCSIDLVFLNKIKLMLNTLGCNPMISTCRVEGSYLMPDSNRELASYDCQTAYRLFINSNDLFILKKLGFSPKRLDISNTNIPTKRVNRHVKIDQVLKTNIFEDVYCLNEPLRNSFIANGVLTGNCNEVGNYTDEQTIAQCILAANVLHNCVVLKNGVFIFDYDLLEENTRINTRALNKVTDKNKYTTSLAKKGGTEQRAIGIGVMGLQDVFFKLDISFTSNEARFINKKIQETIYYAALDESNKIAKETGVLYKGFSESNYGKGVLQFDMWDAPQDTEKWNTLKESIKKYGLSNSLVTAKMPTATSSNLFSCLESFEPQDSNIFIRRTMSGDFVLFNKYLIHDLQKLNIWGEQLRLEIIDNNGSVQDINFLKYFKKDMTDGQFILVKNSIKHLKEKYRTVWEIKQKDLIDMIADTAIFVDQSISMNLYVKSPNHAILSSMHMYTFDKKMKTGIYYLRSKSKTDAGQVKQLNSNIVVNEQAKDDNSCIGCSV